MKRNLVLVFCLTASTIQAQQQQTNELDALKRQLQEASENFDRSVREHRKIIDDLNRRLEQVQAGTNRVSEQSLVTPGATNTVEPDQSRLTAAATGLRMGTQRTYMDIGLVGTFAAGSSTASDIEGGTQLGGHDPNQRGFTVQGVEATFSG